jgi:glutathione peroxidase
LYEEFRDRGFAVLGFPANDFAGQEPGSNEEIVEFCTGTYGVQFPLFSKITVTGAGKHPLYAELTSARYPMPTVTRRHFAAICAATG